MSEHPSTFETVQRKLAQRPGLRAARLRDGEAKIIEDLEGPAGWRRTMDCSPSKVRDYDAQHPEVRIQVRTEVVDAQDMTAGVAEPTLFWATPDIDSQSIRVEVEKPENLLFGTTPEEVFETAQAGMSMLTAYLALPGDERRPIDHYRLVDHLGIVQNDALEVGLSGLAGLYQEIAEGQETGTVDMFMRPMPQQQVLYMNRVLDLPVREWEVTK